MRKSSQPRCAAAVLGNAASNGAKPLGMVLNFGQAIFARR
jgi:hypothetical protein